MNKTVTIKKLGYEAIISIFREEQGWIVGMLPGCRNISSPQEITNYALFVQAVAFELRKLRKGK